MITLLSKVTLTFALLVVFIPAVLYCLLYFLVKWKLPMYKVVILLVIYRYLKEKIWKV